MLFYLNCIQGQISNLGFISGYLSSPGQIVLETEWMCESPRVKRIPVSISLFSGNCYV